METAYHTNAYSFPREIEHATDEAKYMLRCLELAKLGLGNTAPNPLVGSVIVHEGKIIGEGYHAQYGKAHAEVVAIDSVKNKNLLSSSTLYVNLEPCAHYGKTPPCADYIIKHNIPKVVIGAIDVNPQVCGKGVLRMEQAGIEVIVGVLEEACWDLNRRFYIYQEQRRPYIILKWAQSFDQFLDRAREDKELGKPGWITDEIDRMLVHKWRTEEQAILIGPGTALKDNPYLTARDYPGKSPLRIVLDRKGHLSDSLHVFNDDANTLVYTMNPEMVSERHVFTGTSEFIPFVLNDLFERNIQSVIIEGGAEILTYFIDSGLWDEARVFTGFQLFGSGVKAPRITGRLANTLELHSSRLYVYRNPRMIMKKVS